MDKDFLIKTYAQMYGPEAGPWNLGAANKYLEYRFADFFEKHFEVVSGNNLCNVGIGAGAWDRYLSYQLKGGTLTSIDIDTLCCRQLKEGLICEENPNSVEVICGDVMTLDYPEMFDIVTMVGSTHKESELGSVILEKIMSFVKKGGCLYYQSLFSDLPVEEIKEIAVKNGLRVVVCEEEIKYGFNCQYIKMVKE